MKIKTIALSSLQNMEHFQLAEHLVAMCKEANIEKLNRLLPALQSALAQENLALNQLRDEEGTEDLKLLDAARDKAYRALQLLVDLKLHGEEAEDVKAAKEFVRVMKAYPRVLQENYDKESGLVKNLLIDLREASMAAHVTRLDASGYLDRLEQANTAFDARYLSRLKGNAPGKLFDIKALRAATDKAINAIVLRLTSLNDLEPETPKLKELTDQYNALADKKRSLLAQRVGTGNAASSKRREEHNKVVEPLLGALEKQLGLAAGSLLFIGKTRGAGKARRYLLSVKDTEKTMWVKVDGDRLVPYEEVKGKPKQQ